MTPYFDINGVRSYVGDCREVLRALQAESVHCVVTSPPYFCMRDYEVDPSVWGGSADCAHEWGEAHSTSPRTTDPWPEGRAPDCRGDGGPAGAHRGRFCVQCGAWLGCLGLEPTPALFLANMVEVFRELRRVLRKDGTLWMNMGDSYASSVNGRSAKAQKAVGTDDRTFRDKPFSTVGGTFKGKDLMMMPHRLAIALQDDGWWVRSDVVWAKNNPMPSSVKDRPTPAHEYLFLLSKSARYYFDYVAIQEPSASETGKMPDNWDTGDGAHGAFHRNGREKGANVDKQAQIGKRQYTGFNERWDAAEARPPQRDNFRRENSKRGEPIVPGHHAGTHRADRADTFATGWRMKRDVWEIATEPCPDAHFATFPRELVRPCVRAGTSAYGVCADCGAPWKRCVDTTFHEQDDVSPDLVAKGSNKGMDTSNGWAEYPRGTTQRETTGWSPTCMCGAGVVPATVLDLFGGSGTVGVVAVEEGRAAVLIDVKAEYADIQRKRIANAQPVLLTVTEAPAGQPVEVYETAALELEAA